MHTSRTTLRAAAALVAAAVVSACSAAADTPAEPRVLTVYLSDDWAVAPAVVDAVRTFEADNPGVDVQVESPDFSDLPTAVRTTMGAGRDVGLAQWHAFAAGARGWAEPLDDVWESFEPDSYLPGAVEDVRWDGSIYGIPLDTNAMVMVTNDDMLEQAGVAPDGIRTFEDLADAARAVSAPRRFGFLASASSWTTYGFIRANGGEVVEAGEAGPPRFTLDAPAVVDTFAFLHGLVAEDHVLAPDRPNFARDARQLFLDGTTAMLFTGTWDVATLQRSDVTFRWSVHPVPRGASDGGTVLGGSSLYVPEGSAQRDLAIAFARHLTSDEVALRLWEEEGRLPARTHVLEDPLGSSEAYATVVRELPAASPMRLIAFPRADRVYEDLLPELLSGDADPAVLLHQAQAAAEAP